MDTLASYKKNSFAFSDYEKTILKEMLNYFKYEIPNGEGSYLVMLNLDEIDFRWSPKMALTDCGVFGTWSWTDKNSVYIRPSIRNPKLLETVESSNYRPTSEQERQNAKTIKEIQEMVNRLHPYEVVGLDDRKIEFITHLTENNGIILSTIFHELYHKFQYNASPILYVMNLGVSKIIGYENSTRCKFSIEGDVRKYIDNEALWNTISKFSSTFIKMLNSLKTKAIYETEMPNLSELDENDPKIKFMQTQYEKALNELKDLKENGDTRAHARFALKLISMCHFSE